MIVGSNHYTHFHHTVYLLNLKMKLLPSQWPLISGKGLDHKGINMKMVFSREYLLTSFVF